MSKPSEESERLVQYLVDHHPECLEVQSENGKTPLALAFSLRRVNCARILIAAGANQATRDSQANNLLHMLLNTNEVEICKNAATFSEFVGLLDQQLIPTLLAQRAGDNAHTPFTHWLDSYQLFHPQEGSSPINNPSSFGNIQPVVVSQSHNYIVTSITNAILDLAAPTNQKHLELFDGAGNTPAHIAVRQNYPQVLSQLLERRPDLLYRENSTGTTPLEMAVDAWVNHTTSPPSRHAESQDSPAWANVLERQPQYFIEGYEDPSDREESVEIMLRVCQEKARQSPAKRRLVSLFEANEVAKRLATTQRASDNSRGRYYRRRRGVYGEEEGGDEVEKWTNLAARW
jgi:hypothetical protein